MRLLKWPQAMKMICLHLPNSMRPVTSTSLMTAPMRLKRIKRPQLKIDLAPVRCEFFEEPSLEFASDRLHLCPKRGITLFGPRSLDMGKRHPQTIRLGFVGTGETIESAVGWLES